MKRVSNNLTDILNKEPEQPMGNIFKNCFSEAKDNLEQKIKEMTVYGLGLKRKRKSKIFSLKINVERKRIYSRRNNGVFKVGA